MSWLPLFAKENFDMEIQRLMTSDDRKALRPWLEENHQTERNILRCQELERQGLMTEAGKMALLV